MLYNTSVVQIYDEKYTIVKKNRKNRILGHKKSPSQF
jgi:hypothetical protein